MGPKNGASIPTKIDLSLPEGMSFEGDWISPEAKEGKLLHGATFERTINVGKQFYDLTKIKVTITFQTFTKLKFLREESLDFDLPLSVIPRQGDAPQTVSLK